MPGQSCRAGPWRLARRRISCGSPSSRFLLWLGCRRTHEWRDVRLKRLVHHFCTLDAACGTVGGEPLGDQPDAVQDDNPNEVVGPDQAIGLQEIGSTLILQRKESPVPYLLMETGAGRWTDRNQENTPPQRQCRNPNLPVRQAEGKCAHL